MRPGARRSKLQRHFSSFPAGAAGLGLLLLRGGVGATLVGQAALSLAGGVGGTWTRLGDGLSILDGCALLTGTVTPAAALLAAGLSLARLLEPRAASHPLEAGAALGLLCLMGLSVALLGPGAFSVDARLFGRREIVVPRATPRSR